MRTPPLAPVVQSAPYDEQVAETFAGNFTSLSSNVTAIAQTNPTTELGPAYLLNGLANSGYWYQVGLSYHWQQPSGGPYPGFNMSYEVFMPRSLCDPIFGCNCEISASVFPVDCSAGVANLRVNPHDVVELSLSFSGGNVTMRAHDWNTTSTMSESYTAGGGSMFVGLPYPGLPNIVANGDGYFTGLMTEQYYATPYYGTGLPVVYRQRTENVSAALMWMEEFDPGAPLILFSDQTQTSISFGNTTLLQYFSSHGTGEAANGTELVTGLTPITLPTLSSSISSTYKPGQQASIVLGVNNPSALAIEITSLKVSTEFGTFDVTSSAPSSFSTDSTFNTNILLPSKLANGTYTVTVVAVLQFLDSQTPGWFASQPIYSSSILTVSGPPVVPSVTTTLSGLLLTLSGVLLPSILALIAAGIVAGCVAIVVIRREVLQVIEQDPLQQFCHSCGGIIEQAMAFCPNCGTVILPVASRLGPEGQTIPAGQPPG
jgi:hypothetical protein